MASENVFSLAQENGWWKPESGQPFGILLRVRGPERHVCPAKGVARVSKAAPTLKLDPNSENFPFSVKAERKLSVNDLLEMFRDYYQDTDFDMTNGVIAKDKSGKVIKSPWRIPS